MKNQRVLHIAKIFLRLALHFFRQLQIVLASTGRMALQACRGAIGATSCNSWLILTRLFQRLSFPTLGIVETTIELSLGILLIIGLYQLIVDWSSAVLLASFAITMTFALGVKAPLGYGVFTAVGAAILLGTVSPSSEHELRSAQENMENHQTALRISESR